MIDDESGKRPHAASDYPQPSYVLEKSTHLHGGSIKIYDTTLRDGEQAPRVAFSPQTKRSIARRLSEFGVSVVDIGFPSANDSDCEALRLIWTDFEAGLLNPNLELLLMCRATEEDVRRSVSLLDQSRVPVTEVTFLLFTTGSRLHTRHKIGPSLLRDSGRSEGTLGEVSDEWLIERNRERTLRAMRLARALGVTRIEFGAEDCSRSRPDDLARLATSVRNEGIARFTFADTVGCLTPDATARYIDLLHDALPSIPIAAHFHDDFGLATINTITALAHGAQYACTTVNGIGERAGNAPLHTVVAALTYLYGVKIPGLRLDRLYDLARYVSRKSGIPLPPNEPIVGQNSFTHESGIHVQGILSAAETYEYISPAEVGRVRQIVYGKHSGNTAIREVLLRHAATLAADGVSIDAHLVEQIRKRLEQEAVFGKEGPREQLAASFEAAFRELGFEEDDVVQMARQLGASSR